MAINNKAGVWSVKHTEAPTVDECLSVFNGFCQDNPSVPIFIVNEGFNFSTNNYWMTWYFSYQS